VQLVAEKTDLWQYYLAGSMQECVDYWSWEKFLDLADCPSTEAVTVRKTGLEDGCGNYVELEIDGRCHDDFVTVTKRFYSANLKYPIRERLMRVVNQAYPSSRKGAGEIIRSVAATMCVRSRR